MVAIQWRAHSRHSLGSIASSPANAPRHIADLLTPPHTPMFGDAASGCTTADYATVRGNIANVRAAQGRRARQGREIVRVSAPMLMSAPPLSRRASTTPGLPHLQTRYRHHKLSRYLALLFAPAIASRLLPPRQLTARALLATHSASPPIANEIGVASKNRFAGCTIFRTRRASYRTSPWCIFRGVKGGRSETLGRAVGGTYGHIGGKPPNPVSRSFSLI